MFRIQGDGEIACYYPNSTSPRLILRVRRHSVLGFNSYELKRYNGPVLLDFDIEDTGERTDWLEAMLGKMQKMMKEKS